MKHSFVKIFSVSLILILLVAAVVYAKDSASENKAVKEYNAKVEAFEKEHDKLMAQLELAYDKNDGLLYREAKNALRELQYPVISKEESSSIESSLSSEDYELANWLYTNSKYYAPHVYLKSDRENFHYSQTYTANPGTDFTLPCLKAPKSLIFKGWGTDENNVIYEAGATIKMPVASTTLYAVFDKDPEIISGANISIVSKEVNHGNELVIPKGKQSDIAFTIKNNGSEDLSNLKITFESEDPLFVILTDSLSCRYLESGKEGVAVFRIISKAIPSTELKGTISISDAESHCWTEDVILTVK